jgi:hypothetical protein
MPTTTTRSVTRTYQDGSVDSYVEAVVEATTFTTLPVYDPSRRYSFGEWPYTCNVCDRGQGVPGMCGLCAHG